MVVACVHVPPWLTCAELLHEYVVPFRQALYPHWRVALTPLLLTLHAQLVLFELDDEHATLIANTTPMTMGPSQAVRMRRC